MVSNSALIYTIATVIVVLFQAGLAVGMPWGAASMGGKYPGKYPPQMRRVAVINIVILGLFALIVLIRANLILPDWYTFSTYTIWLVVAFGGISVILNSITKSKIERIWIPVALAQFITSIIIALD